MSIVNKILKWNIEQKGTNLLTYGVILLFFNIFFVKIFDFNNKELIQIIHFLGFSITFLGGTAQGLFMLHANEKSIFSMAFMKYILLLSNLIFFTIFIIFTIVFFVHFIEFIKN